MELVYGIVKEIEYKPLRIQAELPDMDGILSPWAMVLCTRSQTAKDYHPPVKGEQVALLLCDNGETALCMGSVMNEADNSPAEDHRFVKVFDDGTRIEYDSKDNHMDINAVGTLSVICTGNATITAPKNTINGETTINGDTSINGNVDISEDATIGGISFLNHPHDGVVRGTAKSNPPVK